MSGLFTQFTDKVAGADGAGDRNSYSLNEDLAIMDMIANEVSLKDIAGITGRSVNSLRYRYKDKNRGVRKILTKGGPAALYQQHKVDVPADLEADSEARIEAFKASLENPAA